MAPLRSSEQSLGGEAGISRIDQPSKRTHGWFVRIYLHGKTLSKFFADKLYDTPEGAREAARAHREAVLNAAKGEGESPLGALYITRMDYARARGWWVRVSIGGGKLVTRLFSDSEFPSVDEARAAATRWRDAVAVHHGVTARAAGRARRPRSLDVAPISKPVAATKSRKPAVKA